MATHRGCRVAHESHPALTHFPTRWQVLAYDHALPTHSLEPTHRLFHDSQHGDLHLRWTSRGHRKGIPALPVDLSSIDRSVGDAEKKQARESDSRKWKVERRKIRWWGWDYWDISWWVAFIFTLGSVFWCINGILFFCFFNRTTLPYTNTEAATGFLGGFTFVVGAWLGWVESLNPARDADFEWVIDDLTKTIREPSEKSRKSLGSQRRHFGRHLSFTPRKNQDETRSGATTSTPSEALASPHYQNTSSPSSSEPSAPWRWYGTSPSLAYIANTIQLFGATTFFISVICGLPGVLPESGTLGGPEQEGRSEGLWIGLYWAMQIIGAPCFVIAGAMFCLETQEKWWKPEVLKIGWQIGFWNLWGGIGFLMCPIFGLWRQTSISNPEIYQYWGTAFSTFLGSWFFLIGSYIQLWEGLNKRE